MKKAPKLKALPQKESYSKDNSYDPRPTITIDESQLPEIKDWKIGTKYLLITEVEMKGISKDDYGENKGKLSANFLITKVGNHDTNK